MLYAKFGRNWISGFEEDENVKSFIQTDGWMDGWTDDRQSEKLTWAFSSGDQAKIWSFPLCINCHDYLSYMYT